jgi:hypothetical protein
MFLASKQGLRHEIEGQAGQASRLQACSWQRFRIAATGKLDDFCAIQFYIFDMKLQ